MIKKYRKKPVIIEAIQLNWKNSGHIASFVGSALENEMASLDNVPSDACGESAPFLEFTIETLEGSHIAKHGDYIIKGIKGEFYPCKPDIFKMTYEEI